MKRLVREFLVVMMLGVVSVGGLAQKQDQGKDKRPKKEPEKVTTNDRKDRPPPRNTNQPKPDNKKKP